MSRVIAYDLTRLFLGPLFLAPRGIDRVDLALARHVFADPDTPHLGILPTPWGVRAYPAVLVRRVLNHVWQLWAEHTPAEGDIRTEPRLVRLIAQILSSSPEAEHVQNPQRQASLSLMAKIMRILGELRVTGIPLGRAADGAVPQGAVYLNVGQLGLAVPPFFRWLKRRPDVTCAIMLHDVIPLEYPHLVRAGHVEHHARMIRTAAEHASCLIFTSVYARDTVSAALARQGRCDVPNLVRHLPLPAVFAETAGSLPDLARCHYFVVVSTIEPRKNHELLLRVWKRLVRRFGDDAPHLVVVGSRGYDADRILAPIAHDPLLRRHVHEVSGLSSPALATLMLGASGLLSPSLAEGFGLPVLEANAMGVPTIASDIAAHREVANASTKLLPGDDDASWEQAVASTPLAGLRSRPPLPPESTEAIYCSDLLHFLEHAGTIRQT